MPFSPQMTEAITFPADGTTLAFFGGGEEGIYLEGTMQLVSGEGWIQCMSSFIAVAQLLLSQPMNYS